MLVTDLNDFLDLPEDVPGPARRLAKHLYAIVRAATAGDAGTAWTSALPCRRRPGRRPCPGRLVVWRSDPPAPIRWHCSACDDEGVISNWEDSLFDLRRWGLAPAEAVHRVVISDDVAASLRDLRLLDPDCERLVFRMRLDRDRIVLPASDDDLEELIGFVAAEANHEPDRRRQRRLDAAFASLSDAARDLGGW